MLSLRKLFCLVLLALVPGAAAADLNAGDLLARGRVDDAISSLQSRIGSAPNDAASYNLLCRAYFTLQDWDRGISACRKAVSLAPNNSAYHLWLARIYGEKADAANFFVAATLAKKVRTEFEAAVQLSPQDVGAITDLAEFYLEAPGIVGGGRDKAQELAQRLDKLDPARAHWVYGRIAEKRKDLATAEKEYRASIQDSHGSDLAWLDLALFYKHVGRLDDMQDAIQHAAAAQSDKPEVLVDAAETLIRTGRDFPGAAKLLRRYLSSSDTVEEAPAFKAHYLLGTVLEKQGDRQAAAQEYRAALSMARSFSPAQDALNRLNR